ncbi:hypothetical protein KKF91_11665 [Myxococcota bacterium]|nr:hypothetical protein [Myxococcota bacterium]MBU1431186.1 hypothetical protein [Myxococcota bacterium]MBU1897871.1 hypothetical protein [Myxococcota bacterium]
MKIITLLLSLAASALPALAAPTSSQPPSSDGAEAEGMSFSLDEVDPPPTPPADLPPMPKDVEDFSRDLNAFGEVTTAPEDMFKAQQAAEARAAMPSTPRYQRQPQLTIAGEAGAGFFAAAALGLLGGAIGDAVDPGDPRMSLGGLHGPVFGGALGTLAGTSLGVWGASRLAEHQTSPGWIVGGAAAGSLLGSAMAFGLAEGMDRDDSASGLAVATFMLSQLGLAVLFTELFEPGPEDKAR